MLANYGYKDGSGEFFITIDTDKCDGCGKCVDACNQNVLEIGADENDPLRDVPVVFVVEEHRKKLKYSCAPCKTTTRRYELPCIAACEKSAITHSW
jgi:ferredoxin